MTKVLDHGYCDLVESWGSDEIIIESARMSTNKGFQGWIKDCPDCEYGRGTDIDPVIKWLPTNCKTCSGKGWVEGDTKLLRYLYEHHHMTPFEMAGMTIEVQAPIMVFREWHRHRTQSYNEMSGRYTELPNICYIPSLERLMNGKQSKSNKQSSEGGFDKQVASCYRASIADACEAARETYEFLLSEGVAKEIARLVLPVNQYSRMRASANLRNWLGFLTLRLDPTAQWEIRQYANTVAGLIEEKFPRTYELFNAGR